MTSIALSLASIHANANEVAATDASTSPQVKL